MTETPQDQEIKNQIEFRTVYSKDGHLMIQRRVVRHINLAIIDVGEWKTVIEERYE